MTHSEKRIVKMERPPLPCPIDRVNGVPVGILAWLEGTAEDSLTEPYARLRAALTGIVVDHSGTRIYLEWTPTVCCLADVDRRLLRMRSEIERCLPNVVVHALG